MADRVTPPPSGGSGEFRPAAPRSTDDYNDRSQTTRIPSSYGERPQSTRSAGSSGGYPQRPPASRSAGGSSSYGQRTARSTSGYNDRSSSTRSSSAFGERRSAAPRSTGGSGGRQPAPRRVDVIRCENCGEDYSVTYKRCPFCDERPGRAGGSGKRVSNTRGGGYGRPVNPIQIAGLVISLALIASALFIVIRFIGAPIFGGKSKPSSSSGAGTSVSQSNVSGSSPNTSSTSPQMVQSIALNNNDFTLESGGTFQLAATLLPAGAVGEVSWSSSDVTLATVDASGLVTNVNTGSSDAAVTISATCNGVITETSVTCKGKTAGGTVAAGTRGRIVNAEKGLNIRSGPGTSYSVVASAQNGASITILGEENGFYKVNYSGDNVGYVSKDYVAVG